MGFVEQYEKNTEKFDISLKPMCAFGQRVAFLRYIR